MSELTNNKQRDGKDVEQETEDGVGEGVETEDGVEEEYCSRQMQIGQAPRI